MLYRNLPSLETQISAMCLGTMTFGGQTDEAESLRIVDCALDRGVNFLDTANIYTGGESERILGKALQGRRDRVVLASKTGGPVKGLGPSLGAQRIQDSVEDSLRRLHTDYLDILYLHFPDHKTPPAEYVTACTELIRSGKIRHYGISNFSAWECCEMTCLARELGAIGPCVSENVYSLINRGVEDELIPYLSSHNMGLTAFNPLAGGLLTGKHSRDHYTENTRFALKKGYAQRYWNDRNFDAIDLLKRIAAEEGMTMVELSFQWLLSRPGLTSVICGVSKLSQFQENATYFGDTHLRPEAAQRCEEAWHMIAGQYFHYHR